MLLGLSQTELGDGIGLTFQAIQKYERGENRLSASRLFAAAKLLGCSVSFFFEGLEKSPSDASSHEFRNEEIGTDHYF